MTTPADPLALRPDVHAPRPRTPDALRARDSQGGPHSNETITLLTARGEARSSGHEGRPAHRLAWVDPETGETLEFDLRCAEAFLDVLASYGFARVVRVDLPNQADGQEPMNKNHERSEAEQSYASAYASQYSERDYSAALRSYAQVIALHPSAPEAEYSRVQIGNIVKNVVPAEELLAAQLELVLRCLKTNSEAPAAVSP